MTVPTRVQIAAALEELRDKGITEGGVRCALAAAAEAGEQYGPPISEADRLVEYAQCLINERAAAIERCAQRLDEKARATKTNMRAAYEDAAATIRAMKDQP